MDYAKSALHKAQKRCCSVGQHNNDDLGCQMPGVEGLRVKSLIDREVFLIGCNKVLGDVAETGVDCIKNHSEPTKKTLVSRTWMTARKFTKISIMSLQTISFLRRAVVIGKSIIVFQEGMLD